MAVRLNQSTLSPFVCPQELLSFDPSTEDAVLPMKGSEGFRLIQNNIVLTEKERARIASFRALQKKMDIKLAPSLQPHIYRYIQMAQNNIDKALQLAVQSQEWRRETYGDGPLFENEMREDLETGFVYFQGRDSSFRPWLIIRVKVLVEHKEWSSKRAIRQCFYAWEYAARYLFIPGKVETMNIVVDCEGVSLMSIPREKLFSVISFAGSPAYPGRLHQLFIVNPPAFFSSIFRVIKAFLSEQDRKKLHVSRGEDLCHGRSALHQMEKKYGGSRDEITIFYPYQLPPGPFLADYDGGPDKDAVAYCHRALCAKTTAGILCETEQLQQTPWCPMAPEIFQECGIPWPNYDTLPIGGGLTRSTFVTQISFDDLDYLPPQISNVDAEPSVSMRLTKVSRLSRISSRLTSKLSSLASPTHTSRDSRNANDVGIGLSNVQISDNFGAESEDDAQFPHDQAADVLTGGRTRPALGSPTAGIDPRITTITVAEGAADPRVTACTEARSRMTDYSRMLDEDDNPQITRSISASANSVLGPLPGERRLEDDKEDILLKGGKVSICPNRDEVFEVELDFVDENKDQFPNEITRMESMKALRRVHQPKRIFKCCPGPPRRRPNPA